MECHEREEKKSSDAAAPFEPERRSGFASRLKVAAAGRREGDELQGTVFSQGSERLGREWPGRAEMLKRGPPAKAVHHPSRSNFVLSPHGIGF